MIEQLNSEGYETERVKNEKQSNSECNEDNPKYEVKPAVIKYYYANNDYELRTNIPPIYSNDEINIDNPERDISMNQKLAGKPNPKTLIPPVIVPPIYEQNYWKGTNISTNNHINTEFATDLYQSGYLPSRSTPEISRYNDHDGSSSESTFSDNQENFKYNYLNLNLDDMQREKNKFVQTIQPNVYTFNDVIEPVSSNIGISQVNEQQFVDKHFRNGNTYYNRYNQTKKHNIAYDPNIVSQEDIYDPRFTGYGTSYRSYFDEFIGQPKFYYDDIDAMRMPNYITRSNIDHLPFANQYGPIQEHSNRGNIRDMVEKSYMNNNINMRNDLQESLMRKRNAEMEYIRRAPRSSGGQRMMGGMGFRG
jgi:hypothetical protein